MSDRKNIQSKISQVPFYSLDEAIKAPINTRTVFIIANERITKTEKIGRYYTVFPTFKEFLNNRSKYKHCHELLIDHQNNKPNVAGRLVFDFDIKSHEIPDNFKMQIENIILDVVEKYFQDVKIDLIEFVWSTSANPNKFSKHLTVKNFYFDNWIIMSKIFYQLFCLVWDETHTWITSNELIDFQIVRNKASLRMVGSSKINGYPLTFDNDQYQLTDSLIRIYLRQQREKEQLITKKNIVETVFTNVLNDKWNIDEKEIQNIKIINFDAKKIEAPIFDAKIYQKAFKLYNKINPNIFKMGKINGKILSLYRLKPNECLLSGKLHEQENAFLIINPNDENNLYFVRFGCYRFCHHKKTEQIGTIDVKNLVITLHPDYDPNKEYCKKIKKIKKIKKNKINNEI